MAIISLKEIRYKNKNPNTKFSKAVIVDFKDNKSNYSSSFMDYVPDMDELLQIIRLTFRNNNIAFNPVENPKFKGARMLFEEIKKIYNEEMDLLYKNKQQTLI